MKHVHFENIGSTQDELIAKIKDGSTTKIISCVNQNQGKGRGLNKWDNYPNSIKFSFVTTPSNTITLSPLEIGVLICDFYQEHDLKLKWPNDFITVDGKKCGGIIIQIIEDRIVVGIGLNLGKSESTKDYKTPKGQVTNIKFSEDDYKNIPAKLFKFIEENRLNDIQILNKWHKYCSHINKVVSIIDETEIIGNFIKIGKNGEAIIETNKKLKKYYTGSLVIH